MSKHRAAPARRSTRSRYAGKRAAPRRGPATALRTTLLMSGVAAAATGVVVSGGVVGGGAATTAEASDLATLVSGTTGPTTSPEVPERADQVSRSDRRTSTDPTKAAALSAEGNPAVARTVDLSGGDPRVIAQALLPQYGFSSDQYSCLNSLYLSESGWQVDADNPTSTAYGIPQALTGLHDLPEGYLTSAEIQIRWGLEYIANSYGTPCGAWAFKQANNWY